VGAVYVRCERIGMSPIAPPGQEGQWGSSQFVHTFIDRPSAGELQDRTMSANAPILLLLVTLQPQLHISAPPELLTVQRRLESIDTKRFADIAELVGIKDAGSTIEVVLAPETSEVARGTSPWIAGFANSPSSTVVLFPSRTPRYPNGSLEEVLRHEVAHIWIGRAAAQRPVPRWFNEGLAMSAEHGWRFADESQLAYLLVIGTRTSLDDIERMFEGSETSQTRAYALAGAFVHDLLRRYGSQTGGQFLVLMNDGASFEHAFTEVVGMSTAEAQIDWETHRLWTEWLPVLTSSTVLWLVVTGLAGSWLAC